MKVIAKAMEVHSLESIPWLLQCLFCILNFLGRVQYTLYISSFFFVTNVSYEMSLVTLFYCGKVKSMITEDL